MLDIEGINRRKKIESDDLLITSIKVSTTHIIPGYSIVDNIDVISAEVVEGMGVVFDWVSDWADMLGGRSQHTESILSKVKQQCIHGLKVEAAMLGANGIVGIDLKFTEFSGDGKSMLFAVATGTAVKIRKD